MTVHSVYIGDLLDPAFHWEGGDWNGNVPRALTPDFPDCYQLFFQVIRLIEDGRLPGKQTDFGGWVAKATKQQIQDLIRQWYKDAFWVKDPTQLPHLNQDLARLQESIAALADSQEYALVATEL